jgi:hypothetical protein
MHDSIFSYKERLRQQHTTKRRHTHEYIQQHTTRLNSMNNSKIDKEKQKQEEELKFNPVLMIGQIHSSRPNTIEEAILQKREGINKTESTNRTLVNNVERVSKIFPSEDNNTNTNVKPINPRWEATLAVANSRACLNSKTVH